MVTNLMDINIYYEPDNILESDNILRNLHHYSIQIIPKFKEKT